jgi:hypothetical protein
MGTFGAEVSCRIGWGVKCAGNSSGMGLRGGPGSFEDFEDDFPSLLVRARPRGILRILRMRLRLVSSTKAGTHKGAGSPRGLELLRGLVPLRGLNSREDGFLREESS